MDLESFAELLEETRHHPDRKTGALRHRGSILLWMRSEDGLPIQGIEISRPDAQALHEEIAQCLGSRKAEETA